MELIARLQRLLEQTDERQSEYVQCMKSTIEDSPYHREASTWVHTRMVVEAYIDLWKELPDVDMSTEEFDIQHRIMFLGGLAALFHDFGKPEVEETLYSEVKGTYRRYAGHERVSAGLFRRVLLDGDLCERVLGERLMLTSRDRAVVAIMIAHHLPYQYGRPKITGVLATIHQLLQAEYGQHNKVQYTLPFTTLLQSDARGRISDDHDDKLRKVRDYITILKDVNYDHLMSRASSGPIAYVLIGPSGAGKSVCVRDALRVDREEAVFSLDDLRMREFGHLAAADATPAERYHAAWAASVQHEEAFRVATQNRLNELVRKKPQVIVSDNMNLSPKSRRQFISQMKQHGYRIVAIVLDVSVEVLVDRGATRGDRGIAPERLAGFHESLTMPTLDEVSDIVLL